MSRIDEKPLSLTQHFEPPEGYVGSFGWICGYSADAIFMDAAAERFTRQTGGQRAYAGRLALALWLDPAHEPLSMLDIPGVAHLAPKRSVATPFTLLHAKVALLSFRHETQAGLWSLRLVVSTGNWTQQTQEQSLDLAWRIDLNADELGTQDDDVAQRCADVAAAAAMFHVLRPHFDERILDASFASHGMTGPASTAKSSTTLHRRLEEWLSVVPAARQGVLPRFFHSAERSMASQLTGLVKRHAGEGSRNYIALASGFFETMFDETKVPGVLERIIASQKAAGLLTARPEVDVVVNQQACQGVAMCLAAILKKDYYVRPAATPQAVFGPDAKRSLHAKFIFGANCRTNSNLCGAAWIYLGSANLTGQGFEKAGAKEGGNLEAGVVFAPGEIYWKRISGKQSDPLICDLLPLQWDEQYEADAPLLPGPGMDELTGSYCATPVAWVNWLDDGERQWVQVPEGATHAVVVRVPQGDGGGALPDAQGRVEWVGSRPRQVSLQWVDDYSFTRVGEVPVLDGFGRLAAAALPRLGIDEAWWQLLSFPQPPDDDDLPSAQLLDATGNGMGNAAPGAGGGDAAYPIRQLMRLVENIAAKQTGVSAVDWAAWCVRLEQCLVQAADSSGVRAFQAMRLNPLAPLRAQPFRPAFAESSESSEGRHYEDVLGRVEHEWKVAELPPVGGQNE